MIKKMVFFISIIAVLFATSCKKSSGGGVTAPVSIDGNVLKINTLLYAASDGVDNTTSAEDILYSISVGVGSDTLTEKKSLAELSNGIKVPKGQDVFISVSLIPGVGGNSALVWLGYPFDGKDMFSSDVTILNMTNNITLTLVASDEVDAIDPSVMYLKVTSRSGALVGGRVKVGEEIYPEGEHSIFFVAGFDVSLEALLPEEDVEGNVNFLAFETQDGRHTQKTLKVPITHGDVPVTATFYNKTEASTVINISLDKNYKDSVKIYIGNTDITKKFIPDINNGNYYIYTLDESTYPCYPGDVLELSAIPNDTKKTKFMSWSDSIKGYLSHESNGFKYIVSADTTIVPAFSAAEGALTVSIWPRTNYQTAGVQHPENIIHYKIKGRDDKIRVDSYKEGLAPLTWKNNLVSGVSHGETVILEATQGEGFYFDGLAENKSKDPSKIKWSGAVSGTGKSKEIYFPNSESQAETVNFEIETRNVTVNIDKYKGTAASRKTPEAVADDAKGYTIKITASGKDVYEFKGASGVKTFDWHTKVKVEVLPGVHYKGDAINGTQNNNTAIDGPNVEDTFVDFTYDLHDTVIHTVDLLHNPVEMTLNIKGGSFDDTSQYIKDKNLIAGVSITGTGHSENNKTYMASSYSENGEDFTPGHASYKFNVLSGVPVNIEGKFTDAAIFLSNTIDDTAQASFHSGASQNLKYTTSLKSAVTNKTGQNSFSTTVVFKSPIHEFTVVPQGFITESEREDDEWKTKDLYKYSIRYATADKEKGQYSTTEKFTLTNGIPVIIKAIPSIDYDLFRIGNEKGALEKTIAITNSLFTNVDFMHRQVDLTLEIVGGKNDRNASFVEISGTGLSASAAKYDAKTGNMIYGNGTHSLVTKNTKYPFKALSGITNHLKIQAVNSSIHNFHKIVATETTGGRPVEFSEGGAHGVDNTSDNYRPGPRAINLKPETNTTIVEQLVSRGAGEWGNTTTIQVNFRINSLQGGLNGLSRDDDGFDLFNNASIVHEPIQSNINGKVSYHIYDAFQLLKLAANGDDCRDKTVVLENDIYLGENDTFDGFAGFRGTFLGNGYVIFDPKVRKAFISGVESASIDKLVVSRGLIGYAGTDNSGLLGTMSSSKLTYITNASRATGVISRGDRIGGIIGYYGSAGNIERLANYSKVYGRERVGGIIGDAYENRAKSYLLANYGEVKGDRFVGGIVGYQDVARRDGVNPEKYIVVLNKGNIYGGDHVGGIIGNVSFGEAEIHNAYNTGNISGTKAVGGLVGNAIGYREIIVWADDRDKDTYLLNNSYSIGYVIGSGRVGTVIGGAGGVADGGHHLIICTYTFGLTRTFPVDRISGGGATMTSIKDYDLEKYSDGFTSDNNYVFAGQHISSGADATLSPEGMSSIIKLMDPDGEKWVNATGVIINGVTTRPVLKELPEVDSMPDWMDK